MIKSYVEAKFWDDDRPKYIYCIDSDDLNSESMYIANMSYGEFWNTYFPNFKPTGRVFVEYIRDSSMRMSLIYILVGFYEDDDAVMFKLKYGKKFHEELIFS